MTAKLSPWFPPRVKPVHVGWYHTNNPTVKLFSASDFNWWWDGSKWLFSPNAKVCVYQNRHWRGKMREETKCA